MLDHHGMTPMEAKRRGGKPGEAKPASGMTRPHDQEAHGEDANGDGAHHHTMTKHEDGSFSSMHTHPDGHKDAMMHHASYSEAKAHMDGMMGEGMEPEEAGEAHPSGGMVEDDDVAGMYSRGQ